MAQRQQDQQPLAGGTALRDLTAGPLVQQHQGRMQVQLAHMGQLTVAQLVLHTVDRRAAPTAGQQVRCAHFLVVKKPV